PKTPFQENAMNAFFRDRFSKFTFKEFTDRNGSKSVLHEQITKQDFKRSIGCYNLDLYSRRFPHFIQAVNDTCQDHANKGDRPLDCYAREKLIKPFDDCKLNAESSK